ncbi:hypothetical protein ACFL39_02030, partial [Gemmatimonadota bacterium]
MMSKIGKYILPLILTIPLNVRAQDHPTIDVGEAIGIIGQPGSEVYLGYADQFSSTEGDTIYIVDMKNNEVLACSPEGELLFMIGGHGQGPGEFEQPRGIIWSNGYLYVSDERMNRVSVFKSDGTFLRAIRVQGRPRGLEVIDSQLFVGVTSGTTIVFAIDLARHDNQTAILTYEQASPSSNPLGISLGQPILNSIGDRLYVGLPNVGRIIQIEGGRVVGSFMPENEYTVSYWKHVRRVETDAGIVIPTVFEGITTWQDRFLLIRFRIRPPRSQPSSMLVFDANSGIEVGPRIIDSSLVFFRLTELPNGLFACPDNGEAIVYLYDL